MVMASPCRVLFMAWLVSASAYSALAAGEGVADPTASLLSKVRINRAIAIPDAGLAGLPAL